MSGAQFDHSEAFLQWIWENMLFDFTDLKTQCGKKLNILSAGLLNVTDGPDFKQSEIEIDGMRWHGDVELHTRSRFWFSHRHHQDENFNSVILHVVAENKPVSVQTHNGSRPFTLNLLPYLSPKLNTFLQSFDSHKELPCASSLNFISGKVFHEQIQKAHQEYFEKKSEDILAFYNAHEGISHAWKEALIISLWDGLGISQNREPMIKVAQKLLSLEHADLQAFLQKANEIAGFSSNSNGLNWNLKAVRPSNHPQIRVQQAAHLSWIILQHSFKNLLKPEAISLWAKWLQEAQINYSNHFKILYGTVYLPSLYLLGKLLAYNSLSEAAFQSWQTLKSPIPASLLSQFSQLNISPHTYRSKLGAVHQLKSYCNAGKCSECLVLKKAILS